MQLLACLLIADKTSYPAFFILYVHRIIPVLIARLSRDRLLCGNRHEERSIKNGNYRHLAEGELEWQKL